MRAIFLLVLIGFADFIFSIAFFAQTAENGTVNLTQEKFLHKEISNETINLTPEIVAVAVPLPTVTPAATPTPTPQPTPSSTPAQTPCAPDWQCDSWGLCINDKQSRTCADGCGVSKTETQTCLSINHIIFTEVFYDTPGQESDEEWLKLFNPTDTANLINWSISDNAGSWKFSTSINPKSFVLIARDPGGFRNLTGCSADISGFTRGLNNDGDYLSLKDSNDSEIDFVAWEQGYNKSHHSWNITAAEGKSIRRISLIADTDSTADWAAAEAQPCS